LANLATARLHTLINKYTKNESDQVYNKGYKVDYLLQRSVGDHFQKSRLN